MRKFFQQFALVGETQERERVLHHFTIRYLECNAAVLHRDYTSQGRPIFSVLYLVMLCLRVIRHVIRLLNYLINWHKQNFRRQTLFGWGVKLHLTLQLVQYYGT